MGVKKQRGILEGMEGKEGIRENVKEEEKKKLEDGEAEVGILRGVMERFEALRLDNDGITCDLEPSEFGHSPTYDALSYAWGEQDSNRPTLQCSGRSISISPHLNSALERFYRSWENDDAADRLPYPRIWVDAVCINQNDHVEKAQQVARMAQIYTRARRVIVWLGEHENGSELAMQLLQDYATAFPDVVRDESAPADELYFAEDLLQLPQGQNNQSWSALSDLFDRPYFKRRWVLQELASGKSVYMFCGADSVPWSALAGLIIVSEHSDIYDMVEGPDRESFYYSYTVVRTRQLVVNEGFRSDTQLLQLYELAQWKRCTEKVDRLLSVIGILPREYRVISVAAGIFDYLKPYWTIFLQFVKPIMEINLHSLSLAGACKTRHPNLPSWCPDFTSEFTYMYSEDSRFVAATGRPVLGGSPTDQILQCRGFQVGTLLAKVDGDKLSLSMGHHTREESQEILLWERTCYVLAQRASMLDKAVLDDTLSRVLVRDFDAVGPTAYEYYDQRTTWHKIMTESYSGWKQAHWHNVETGDSKPCSTEAVAEYDKLVLIDGEDTTFFTTVQGRLGLSNSKIQPKDVVYVLYGGKAPFVLRPNHNDNTMQLVGDAYLDGVMYGEALTADNKMPDEWVNLV
ncbi:MAG: hypothetical protein L6R42_007535 [Xanthoria sp. 1 TBL-2021]|nr:MAG: hypothetical protein L6R42_007535 [Xanthoria sp. 1 TBL-2021]